MTEVCPQLQGFFGIQKATDLGPKPMDLLLLTFSFGSLHWMVFDTCTKKSQMIEDLKEKFQPLRMNTSTKDFSIYYRNLGRPCEPNIDPFDLASAGGSPPSAARNKCCCNWFRSNRSTCSCAGRVKEAIASKVNCLMILANHVPSEESV